MYRYPHAGAGMKGRVCWFSDWWLRTEGLRTEGWLLLVFLLYGYK